MPALYFLSLQRDLILSTNAAYTGRSSPVSKAPKHGACVGDWTGAPPTGLQSQHVFCFSPPVRTPPPFCMQYLALLGRNWMHRIPWGGNR